MQRMNQNEVILTKKKEIELRDRGCEVYSHYISNYQHDMEVASALKKLKPSISECILDLGCGTGRITYKLLEYGCIIVGLDFSGESLIACRSQCNELQKNNLHLIRADACNLPLKNVSFDRCISSEVLEHIPSESERSKMIREVNRILKPGGTFLLTTYNYSIRKFIGRKRETPKIATLYSYRYDYLKLRKLLSGEFNGTSKITGLLNFNHWIPKEILNKHNKLLMSLDTFIERTPFSYLLAHLLSAECKKSLEYNPNNGQIVKQ